MSTVRLRRLNADYAKLKEYARRHPRVKLLQADGDPPERYQLEYQVKSLRMTGAELTPVQSHVVEISLPRNYPRTPPQCRMLTPVFHPNIAPHAICVGDHWGAAESLESIVIRIGEMLAYQSYNVKSPLNGEAARWVEEHKDQLPLDRVSMLVEEPNSSGPGDKAPPTPAPPPRAVPARRIAAPSASVPEPAAPAQRQSSPAPHKPASSKPPVEPGAGSTVNQLTVSCPQCNSVYRLPLSMADRKVRCHKCMAVFNTGPSPI